MRQIDEIACGSRKSTIYETPRHTAIIFLDTFLGLDHRVGHGGVLHMTVESMGGSAHTQ